MIKGVNPTFFKNVTYVFNSPPARHDGGLFYKGSGGFFFGHTMQLPDLGSWARD